MNPKRRSLPFVLLVLALTAAPSLGKPKKPALPEPFGAARTVFVESRSGSSITDISLDSETRNAILDVQDAIEHWGRYTLSRSRHDADLILVVNVGRIVRDQPDGQPGGTIRLPSGSVSSHSPIQDPSDASQGNNPSNGISQERDELRVYNLGPNDKLKSLLWHSEEVHGLEPPSVMLVRRLKIDVENSYPTPPAATHPTP